MNQLIKYPGSKWQIAKWIISFFPEHYTYLEPYFGSGSIYFTKQPSRRETINDIDEQVVNLFKVCREHPEELSEAIYLTPYARKEYESIQENHAGQEIQLSNDPVENARRFAIRCSQSFGSKMADRASWKTNRNSKGPIAPRIWNRMPETVIEVANRLKDAQIECKPAVQLITDYNFDDCLIYADPPYPISVRGSRLYRREMQYNEEHIELLEALKAHKGPVVLSSYDNDMYNDYLRGWNKECRTSHTNSGKIKQEVLWMNFK